MVEAVVVAAAMIIVVAVIIAAANPSPFMTTVQPHEEETVELRVQQVGAHCFYNYLIITLIIFGIICHSVETSILFGPGPAPSTELW